MSLIVVLGGAGFHSPILEPKYKSLLKVSCQRAVLDKSSTVNCVIKAIEALEESDLTNAGYGSSLTRTGSVELDAIVQDGSSGQFGAVGCVASIRNPITAAGQLLERQEENNPSGLVSPSFLVGQAVIDWLRLQPTTLAKICSPSELIAPERFREFDEYQKTLKLPKSQLSPQDTVGAIAISDNFQIACGSSSGGAIMKFPGRIGPAAVLGASCWSEQTPKCCCGVVVSGEGEFIMAKLVARSLAGYVVTAMQSSTNELLVVNAVCEAFDRFQFFNTDCQIGLVLVYASFASCESEENQDKSKKKPMIVDVVWAHSTPSLAVGFHQSNSSVPIAKMSRISDNKYTKKPFVEGKTFLVD